MLADVLERARMLTGVLERARALGVAARLREVPLGGSSTLR